MHSIKKRVLNRKNELQTDNTAAVKHTCTEDTENHAELPTRYIRLNRCSLEDSMSDSLQMADETGLRPIYNMRLLRPRSQLKSSLENAAAVSTGEEMNSYRILHGGKTGELFRAGYAEHRKQAPTCKGILVFDTEDEQQ